MAKLFIGIALVVMLATAALGFLAKSNIDKLQTSLKDTKGRIAAVEGQAKTAKADAEKAQKDAKDAVDKADAATQQLATKAKEADDATKGAAEAKALVEASTAKIAQLEKDLEAAKTGPKPKEGDDPRIAEAQKQADDAKKEAAEAKQLFDSQSGKFKDMETKLAAADKKERDRANQFQKPGLQGRILAVNGGWNFVVLSVGDKQGVIINSPLLVVRGNEPIARLRITSVEPSTSIADVLPGSVRRGVTVQPGDTVIFEGTRSSPQAASKPAAEAPVTTPTVPPLP